MRRASPLEADLAAAPTSACACSTCSCACAIPSRPSSASSLDDLRTGSTTRMHNKMFVADNALAVFGGRKHRRRRTSCASPAVGNFGALRRARGRADRGQRSASYRRSGTATMSIRSMPSSSFGGLAAGPLRRPRGGRRSNGPRRRSARCRSVRALRAGARRSTRRSRIGRTRTPSRASIRSTSPGRRLTDRRGTVARSSANSRAPRAARSSPCRWISCPERSACRRPRSRSRRGVRMRAANSRPRPTSRSSACGYMRYAVPMMRLGLELYEPSPSLVRQSRLGRFWRAAGHAARVDPIVDRKSSSSVDGIDPPERCNTEIGLFIDSPEIAGELIDTPTSAQLVGFGSAPIARPSSGLFGADESQVVYTREPRPRRTGRCSRPAFSPGCCPRTGCEAPLLSARCARPRCGRGSTRSSRRRRDSGRCAGRRSAARRRRAPCPRRTSGSRRRAR